MFNKHVKRIATLLLAAAMAAGTAAGAALSSQPVPAEASANRTAVSAYLDKFRQLEADPQYTYKMCMLDVNQDGVCEALDIGMDGGKDDFADAYVYDDDNGLVLASLTSDGLGWVIMKYYYYPGKRMVALKRQGGGDSTWTFLKYVKGHWCIFNKNSTQKLVNGIWEDTYHPKKSKTWKRLKSYLLKNDHENIGNRLVANNAANRAALLNAAN